MFCGTLLGPLLDDHILEHYCILLSTSQIHLEAVLKRVVEALVTDAVTCQMPVTMT